MTMSNNPDSVVAFRLNALEESHTKLFAKIEAIEASGVDTKLTLQRMELSLASALRANQCPEHIAKTAKLEDEVQKINGKLNIAAGVISTVGVMWAVVGTWLKRKVGLE